MSNATFTRLPGYRHPWAWSMRLTNTDSDTFDSVITSLKHHIHMRKRKWEPATKRWLFHAECLDTVQDILELFDLSWCFEGDDEPTRHRRQDMSKEQAAAELYLLPSAPPEVITAVYRVLAKQYHPDTGGDLVKMQKLNAAVEVLR